MNKRWLCLLLAALLLFPAAAARGEAGNAWEGRGEAVDASGVPFADVFADWNEMTFEKTAVRLAQQIGATWRESGKVWKSVSLDASRLLFEREGDATAYLISADGSLRAIPTFKLPAEYAPENVMFFTPPDADGVMAYKIEAGYYGDATNQDGEFRAFPQNTMQFNVASHEAFHAFQSGWSGAISDQEAMYEEAARNPRARILRVHLIESLRQAVLRPEDADALLRAASWWYARYREEYPRECALAAGADIVEGTARYFDMALCVRSALGMDADAQSIRAAYQALIREDYALDGGRYDGYVDSESYDLGGAACVLLELAGVKNWQSRVEAGETPAEVLLEAHHPAEQSEDAELVKLVNAALGVSADFSQLDATDQSMLKNLDKLYACFRAQDAALWPCGYDFTSVPLIMVRVDKDKGDTWHGAYALNIKTLPAEWRTEEIALPEGFNLPPIVRIEADASDAAQRAWRDGNFHFADYGGAHAIWFKYYPENADSFEGFLCHEAFHEFVQMSSWDNVLDLTSRLYQPRFDPKACAMRVAEWKLLDRAMDAEGERQDALLSDYAFLRACRYNSYPDMEEESRIEALEGSAQYVEARVKNAMAGKELRAFDYRFQTILDKLDLALSEYPDSAAYYFCQDSYYYSGAMIENLLDTRAEDWARKLQSEQKTPWELLLSAVLPNGCADDEARLDRILKENGYDAKLGETIAEVLNRSQFCA